MLKYGFVGFIFVITVLGSLAAQDQSSAGKSNQVVLKYLGTAGWEITDGTTVVLIDPYLSRINGPAPPGGGSGHSMAGDSRRAYGWNDAASPDVAAIDSHIQRADFILVTHTHYDHVLDVPHIAHKTGAAVVGTESTENVMRAYGLPEEQLLTVRGGEDYQFSSFSLKVIPSIHSPLDHKTLLQFRNCAGWNESTTDLGTDPPGGRHSRLLDSFSQSSNSRVWRHELYRTRAGGTGARRRIDWGLVPPERKSTTTAAA
jgi:hypothetical protein